MKKSILTTAVLVAIATGVQAADQWAGDGTTDPISISGTMDWDTTSSVWLDSNAGGGTYGTWANGNTAVFSGDAPIITVTDAISVGDIYREADAAVNDDGRMDLRTTGSGSLTFNNTTIATRDTPAYSWGTVARQFNLGAADVAGNTTVWGGNIILGDGVNRFLLTGTQTISAGSSITAATAGNVIRLASSVQTDFSNLELTLDGTQFQNWNTGAGADITVGALNGSGTIDISAAQATTINSISVGDATTIGALSGDMAVTMGSGTHSFDLLSLSGVNTADKLAGSSAAFGGDLVVSLLAGSDALENGDSFDLFDGTLSGSFSSVSLPALGGALSWDTSALASTGTITVIPEPATLGLVAAMGGSILFIRRRFMM